MRILLVFDENPADVTWRADFQPRGAGAPDSCTDRIALRFVKDRYGWSISAYFCAGVFFNLGTTRGVSIEETTTGGFQLAEGCSTCIDEKVATLLMNSSGTDLEGA